MDVKTPATAVTVRGRGRLVGVDVAERICAVPDCAKPHLARGWCGAHYARWKATGDVGAGTPLRPYNPGAQCSADGCERVSEMHGMCEMHCRRARYRPHPVVRRTMRERFWEKVTPSDGCWEWQGTRRRPENYGVMTVARRVVGAHRLSWLIHYGAIPDGMCVCHRCDNPPCVRPDHLFLGTVDDNWADMRAKGRNVKGENVGTGRLTTKEVLAIRERRAAGDGPSVLARAFGVNLSTIHRVVRHDTWQHLP